MKKIQKLIWVIIMFGVVGGTLAFAMGDRGQVVSGTWRYKMTVTVETPEGIKTGSAVREVYVQRGLSLTPEMTPHVELKGEAVVVDLGQRGVLFALLNGYYLGADYGSDIPGYALYPKQGWLSAEGIREMSTLKAGPTALDPTWYPKFVWFRDINDPKTVENLLEMESDGRNPPTFTIKKDRFVEAFGAGVKLHSVTIEMTDEPVTWGIDTWLPWFEPRRKAHTRGPIGVSPDKPFEDPTGTFLTSGAFKSGER